MNKPPVLAVILVGDDPVSLSYVGLKQKIAQEIGIDFQLFHYSADAKESEVLENIDELNNDENVSGIMVQIPVPEHIDRTKIIEAISPQKDVDGLRYCQGLNSDFHPPVVCAIAEVIKLSGIDLADSSVALIGRGFLVGEPLERYLKDQTKKLVVANSLTSDLSDITKCADVIISATGVAGLIKSEMVKEGVVLIDAGTSEVGGKQVGDIDSKAYDKASFHTPVPGGIGPVTVAYLMKNLIK